MKSLRILIALFALLVALKGGKALMFPGDNIIVLKGVQCGEKVVPMGVVYDMEGKELMRIPADLIVGVGAIADEELKPKREL